MSAESIAVLVFIGLLLVFVAWLVWNSGKHDFGSVEAKQESGDYADNYKVYRGE